MENFENFFFQYVHKIQKIFGIMKKKILKFSLNSEQETISCNFFNYREALPPYTPVFVDDPTSLTGASVLRPWNRRSDAAKDNRLKLQSTGSRVLLLISVSESGLISEFFTSNLLRFYTNFTGAFFHDSNYFLTFYSLGRKKRILFAIFPTPKNFNYRRTHNFFGKPKKFFFPQTYFFMILSIFWTFYPFKEIKL